VVVVRQFGVGISSSVRARIDVNRNAGQLGDRVHHHMAGSFGNRVRLG